MSGDAWPTSLDAYLRGFAARRRTAALLRRWSLSIGFESLWIVLWCLVDRLTPLPAPVRLTVLLVGLGAGAFLLVRPVAALLRRRVDRVAVAAQIEAAEPAFAQRLLTVASQLSQPPRYRAAPDLLRELTDDATAQAEQAPLARLVPARGLLWHAMTPVVILAALSMLLLIPWLDMPALLRRYALPMGGTMPVTTTRLELEPGDLEIAQGQPLSIVVHARNLGGDAVRLHLGEDSNWSELLMAGSTPGRFQYTMAAPQRDLSYYATGGDARTRTFRIRVLRAPAVREFRIRYLYPPYTGRAPLSTVNTDGIIEAPVGTEAQLAIACTEPLSDLQLVLDGRTIPSTAAMDPAIRQLTIRVTSDSAYQLHIVSRDGMVGQGPATAQIRALPDRAPLVRLTQPADDVRMTPRDVLPLRIEALDDFGLESVTVQVRWGDGPPRVLPVALEGDPRRQDRAYDLDMSTLPLKIGDVLELSVDARDRSAQAARSAVRHVLITPRSIDVDQYLLLGELAESVRLARALADEVDDASRAFTQARAEQGRSADARIAIARADRGLADASQTALLLRQSLLRATMRSRSAQMSVFLGGLVDAAQVQASGCEQVDQSIRLKGASDAQPGAQLGSLREQLRRTQTQLQAVVDGQRAEAALGDFASVRTLAGANPPSAAVEPPTAALRQNLDRAMQDVTRAAAALGLDPDPPGLEAQLQSRINAAASTIAAAQAPDFVALARDWSEQLAARSPPIPTLAARLAAASQAEIARPDALYMRGRDLQIASAAVIRIEAAMVSPAAAGRFLPPVDARTHLADVWAAIQRQHELLRAPSGAVSADQQKRVIDEAAAARQQLLEWAGQVDVTDLPAAVAAATTGPAPAPTTLPAEVLVYQANSRMAAHDYAAAARYDRALAARSADDRYADRTVLQLLDRAAASMRQAERIDEIEQRQRELAAETRTSATTQAASLAQRQRRVTQQITEIRRAGANAPQPAPDSTETRQAALEAVQLAQQRLATMPQQLGDALQAAAVHQDAAERAAAAQQALEDAPADEHAAAQRMLEQAQLHLDQADRQLVGAAELVGPDAAGAVAAALAPFSPETAAAVDTIHQELLPALAALGQSLRATSQADPQRFAGDARSAIARVQEELKRAQDQVVARDPLIAARWYSTAAAELLAEAPTDLQAAQSRQGAVSDALGKAWSVSIHEAGRQRLATTSSMAFLLAPSLWESLRGTGSAQETLLGSVPGLREWGRLRPRESDSVAAPEHEADTPGYEESLKAYFQAIGQTTQQSGEGR